MKRGAAQPCLLVTPPLVASGGSDDREPPNELASTVDLFPTLLGYAGVPRVAHRLGLDLRPLLEGGSMEGRDALVGKMDSRLQEEEGGFFVRTAPLAADPGLGDPSLPAPRDPSS
jgi:arylsulfatase A-like enzyme